MKGLPWWTRVGAKIVLARLPVRYSVWQRMGLFRHGAMDESSYAIGVFAEHVRRAGLQDSLRGLTVLELGPGDSIASAIIAAAHGAKAILVDAGAFVRADTQPYHRLAAALRALALDAPEIGTCTSVPEILERCGAAYLTQGVESLGSLKSASVDLIFSQAVLEHVRRSEFTPTMRECRRILKPGSGLASHRVDLKDHLGGALNNLRFRGATWESDFFVASGFYTNRLRFHEMLGVFSQSGFVVRGTSVRRWPALPTPRRALAPEFTMFTDDELLINGFDVLLA